MNFALLFFITLFTGILATNTQPLRAAIKILQPKSPKGTSTLYAAHM